MIGSCCYRVISAAAFLRDVLEELEIELGVEGKRVFFLAWAGGTTVA